MDDNEMHKLVERIADALWYAGPDAPYRSSNLVDAKLALIELIDARIAQSKESMNE